MPSNLSEASVFYIKHGIHPRLRADLNKRLRAFDKAISPTQSRARGWYTCLRKNDRTLPTHHSPAAMASRFLLVKSPLLRNPRPVCGPFARRSILFRKLSLAYTLQNPMSSEIPLQSEPLILLHGLFGSRKNFQSIHKYVIAIQSINIYKNDAHKLESLHGISTNQSTPWYVRILCLKTSSVD